MKKLTLTLFALLAAATPLAAQTTFVKDAFTGTNGTLLEAHTPTVGGTWFRALGSGLQIQGNALRPAANVAGDTYGNSATAPASEYIVGVTATFTTSNANNYVELYGRGNLSLSSAYFMHLTSTGSVTLGLYVGATLTVLATGTVPITLNTPHFVLLSLTNASKQVIVDGTVVASSTNNTLTSGGQVGLGLQSNTTGSSVADDYFASTFAPTAARLGSMSARSDGKQTLVAWTTAHETDTLGFHVYRQEGDRRVVLPGGLVAGGAFTTTGALLPAGNSYQAIDDRAGASYWIEEVDLDGHVYWHGPIVPQHQSAPIVTTPRPALPLRAGIAERPTLRSTTNGVSASSMTTGRRRLVDMDSGLTRQWELAAGHAVKISVTTAGWQRVTQPELLAAGLDPSSDPRTLQLYADGAEVPVEIEGESDGRLDATDTLSFYGEPLDTNASGTRVYWLIVGVNAGARLAHSAATAVATPEHNFPATVERRDKLLFFAALLDPDSDNFFGEVISSDPAQPTQQTLTLQHLDVSSTTASIEVGVQGGTDTTHRVHAALNGHDLGDLSLENQENRSQTFTVPIAWLVDGTNTVSLTSLGGDEDASAVDHVRITYPHLYVADRDSADGDSLLLTAGAGAAVEVAGLPVGSRAFDVTSPTSPVALETTFDPTGNLHFVASGSGTRTVLAIAPTAVLHPQSVVANTPTALHASAGADIVLLTNPAFVSALAPLLRLREEQGHSVLIATTQAIYDEFSFGSKDPAAIRTFLTRTSMWTTPAKSVLLVGDATYDPRNYLGQGDFDLVPTKLIVTNLQKSASDAWLADRDGDGIADVGIGRLPVRTLSEAAAEIGKIVAYERAGADTTWSRRVVLVSDSDPAIGFDQISHDLREHVPSAYSVDDVDVVTAGVTASRQQLLGDLDGGALLVNYVGHGSVAIWTSDGLLGSGDAASLTNDGRLPFVIAMTCLNGYFQDLTQQSLAESLLAAPHGGAIGVWASSTLTNADQQEGPNAVMLDALFQGATLGDAAITAQRAAHEPDVRRSWILFGDPATKLHVSP